MAQMVTISVAREAQSNGHLCVGRACWCNPTRPNTILTQYDFDPMEMEMFLITCFSTLKPPTDTWTQNNTNNNHNHVMLT